MGVDCAEEYVASRSQRVTRRIYRCVALTKIGMTIASILFAISSADTRSLICNQSRAAPKTAHAAVV